MSQSKFDLACAALAEAKTLDEVSTIRDQAQTMRELGRRMQCRQLEIDAAELRQRAERRYGEFVLRIKSTAGLNAGTRGQLRQRVPIGGSVAAPPKDSRPRLADLGLDKKMSVRCQEAAAIPAETFESGLRDWRDRVERGDLRSSASVVSLVRRQATEAAAKAVPAPSGRQYETLVVNPAWPIVPKQREVGDHAGPAASSTMTVAEIRALELLDVAAADSHLWCWTTQRFRRDAEEIVQHWGFRVMALFVWHTPGGLQPMAMPQYNCEFVVYGRRGKPEFSDTKGLKLCFGGARGEDSRKPDEFYDMVRRATAGPRLHAFAREEREGFEAWDAGVSKIAKQL